MRRVKPKKSKKGWIIAAVVIMILLAMPKGSKNKGSDTASKQEPVQETAETAPAAEETAEEIDAQFKENVDTCEQFLTAYAALLKKISDGDTSAETMETYSQALENYTKVSEWLNSVDRDKLNAAEAAYYNDAMVRMAGKLTEIAAFKPAETAAEPEEETADESYIDPEFKAAMDSYEAFFDEYIELTNRISSGNSSADTMMQYANYMAKYADVMQKLEDINEDELTAAELLYYEEVMLRITQKLQALN